MEPLLQALFNLHYYCFTTNFQYQLLITIHKHHYNYKYQPFPVPLQEIHWELDETQRPSAARAATGWSGPARRGWASDDAGCLRSDVVPHYLPPFLGDYQIVHISVIFWVNHKQLRLVTNYYAPFHHYWRWSTIIVNRSQAVRTITSHCRWRLLTIKHIHSEPVWALRKQQAAPERWSISLVLDQQ